MKQQFQRLWSRIANKWVIACQVVALTLPALIFFEASQLKFPFSDLKALWLAMIAYLGGVVWVIRGKSKEDNEAGRIRSLVVWLLRNPVSVTLIAFSLLVFSVHLWERMRYFNLSETERKTLITWSDLSLQSLSLLEGEVVRCETDFQLMADLDAITFGSRGRPRMSVEAFARPRLDAIKDMEHFCKELGAIARFQPKGNLFGPYERQTKLHERDWQFFRYVPDVEKAKSLYALISEMRAATRLRDQTTSFLRYSATPMTNLVGLIDKDVENIASLLAIHRSHYVAELQSSNLATDTPPNPRVLEGLGAFYVSQTVNKMLDRRKRIRLLLSDLSLYTAQLEEQLRTDTISHEDSLEIEQRLRSLRNSLAE